MKRNTPMAGPTGRSFARANQTYIDRYYWISSPLFVLSFVSIYVGGLFLLDIVELAQPLASNFSAYYLVGSIMVMMVTMALTLFKLNKELAVVRVNPVALGQGGDWLRYFPLLLSTGALSAVCMTLDFGLTIGFNKMDYISLRESFGDREVTLFAYPANVLAPFTSITLGVTIIFYERFGRVARVLGLLVGVSVPIIDALAQAGRGGIFELCVIIPFWCMQRPAFDLPILPRGSLLRYLLPVTGVGLLVALSFISISRSQEGGERYESVIWFNRNVVTPSPLVREAIYKMPPLASNFATEALLYWTGPITTFDKIAKDWSLRPAYFSAISPILNRRLVALGISPSPIEIWMEQSKILLSYEIYPNMFVTTPGTLIMSFGRSLTFIVMIVVSFIASYIYAYSRKRRDLIAMYVSSILFLWFALFFQKSVFIYPLHEYGIIYGGIAYFLKSTIGSKI